MLAPRQAFGQRGRCPKCGGTFVLPAEPVPQAARPAREGEAALDSARARPAEPTPAARPSGSAGASPSRSAGASPSPRPAAGPALPRYSPLPQEAKPGGLRIAEQPTAFTPSVPEPEPVPTNPCPTCGSPVPARAKLCVNCGTRVQSGHGWIRKERGDVSGEAEEIRSWVNGVSLILPLAIVPYRSTIPQLRSRLANHILVGATIVLSMIALIAMLSESEHRQLSDRSVLSRYGLWPGEKFAPTQLVSHVFVHAGLAHLAGNMLFLWMFGGALSAVLGWRWYPALYLAFGAVAGYLGHVVFGTPQVIDLGALGKISIEVPLVGASGAICGLSGMYLVLFPRHDIHMAIWLRIFWWWRPWVKTFAMTGIYAVLFFTAFDVAAIVLGWTGSVAHAVHLSGFGAGIVVGVVFLFTGVVKSEGYDLLTWLFGDRWRPRTAQH